MRKMLNINILPPPNPPAYPHLHGLAGRVPGRLTFPGCATALRLLAFLSVFPFSISAQNANEVWLDDREPHSWSYYSDPACPIHSLNPADVKITYYGYGARTMYSSSAPAPTGAPDVDVAAGAVGIGIDVPGKNTYVYLKTLERVNGEEAGSMEAADGTCFYRLIPNPYSLRPTHGSGDTRWRGFYKWRLKRLVGGGIYSDSAASQPVAVGDMLDAEDTLFFLPAAEYGMEADFEAVWARAFVCTDLVGFDTLSDYATGANAYERNFVVIRRDTLVTTWSRQNGAFGRELTITAVYPDGTDGHGATATLASTAENGFDLGSVEVGAHGGALKFEYIFLSKPQAPNNNNPPSPVTTGINVIAGGADRGHFVMGRGMLVPGHQLRYLAGANNGKGGKVRVRLESGYVGCFHGFVQTIPRASTLDLVVGSDYDRSVGDNTRLILGNDSLSSTFRQYDFFYGAAHGNCNTYDVSYSFVFKSGTYGRQGLTSTTPPLWRPNLNNGGASSGYAMYLGSGGTPTRLKRQGLRKLTMEGGLLNCSLAGGADDEEELDTLQRKIDIRIRGGIIRGSVYGAAAVVGANGNRRMVFTGGTVNGWIAGGCNGTNTGQSGPLLGKSYIYFGGRADCQHASYNPRIAFSYGGNIYGAGSGHSNSNVVIGTAWSSTLVVADSAHVSRNVYGGGNYGYVNGTGSDIHLLGGQVDGKVFGGSNYQQGRKVDIVMRGGQVVGGIYGGSNMRGEVSGPVTIRVEEGIVGSQGCADTVGNVFGGGYGTNSSVTGPVHVVIGREDAKWPHVNNPLIHGNVYGGGFGGTVTASPLKVTTHNGRIKRHVFGGGYGKTAVVTANPEVSILGTTHVEGNVYGGGNLGKINGDTRVVIGE